MKKKSPLMFKIQTRGTFTEETTKECDKVMTNASGGKRNNQN